MNRYIVAVADALDDLQHEVSDHIEKGYRPAGGVEVFRVEWENERKGYSESSTEYLQALWLPEA